MSDRDYNMIAKEEQGKVATWLITHGFSQDDVRFTKDDVTLVVRVQASWGGFYGRGPTGTHVTVRTLSYFPDVRTRTYRYGKNGFNYESILRGANEMVVNARPLIAKREAEQSENERLDALIEPYGETFVASSGRIKVNIPVPDDRLQAVYDALRGDE